MRSVIVLAIALAACGPVSVAAPSAIGTATPSATPTAPTRAYLEVSALGDFMLPSPDGRLIVSFVQTGKGSTVPPRFVFQRVADGAVIGQVDNLTAMGRPQWLPDSSGVFIELAAGQRAGPLGVIQPDGRLIETGLDDANPLLSPDGKWIAAERQEGCCVAITVHEIRVAPRSGGAARALVRSNDPAQQPVAFLGWSASGSVIYRDGAAIRGVTLDGHISDAATPPSMRGRAVTRSAVSPDGRVILACAADPLAFWVVTAESVSDLPGRPAWPLRGPWCSRSDEVIWIGMHGLATREGSGAIATFDPIAGTVRPVALPVGATLLAASGSALLVSLGDEVHVLSADGDRAVGLRATDLAITPLDGGRFFLASGRSGYLVGEGIAGR